MALMKISTRIATSGTIRTAQKPNMIHLFRMARRALRCSNSLGAKGLPAMGAAEIGMARSLFILNLIRLFDSLDDQVRGHINAAGNYEQHDAKHKEHAVMVAAVDGLAHLRRDGGGHRSEER